MVARVSHDPKGVLGILQTAMSADESSTVYETVKSYQIVGDKLVVRLKSGQTFEVSAIEVSP
jgi:hypothetical protein